MFSELAETVLYVYEFGDDQQSTYSLRQKDIQRRTAGECTGGETQNVVGTAVRNREQTYSVFLIPCRIRHITPYHSEPCSVIK